MVLRVRQVSLPVMMVPVYREACNVMEFRTALTGLMSMAVVSSLTFCLLHFPCFGAVDL